MPNNLGQASFYSMTEYSDSDSSCKESSSSSSPMSPEYLDHDIAVRTLAQVPNVSVNVARAQKYHHSLAELRRFAAANVRDSAADNVDDFEVLVRVFVFVVRGRSVRRKVFVREQTLGDIARDHGFSPCDDRSLFSDYTTITISKSMKMSMQDRFLTRKHIEIVIEG